MSRLPSIQKEPLAGSQLTRGQFVSPLWQTVVPSGPRPGDSAVDALGLQGEWTGTDGIDIGGLQGYYHGQSPDFITFGPAVQELCAQALHVAESGARVCRPERPSVGASQQPSGWRHHS